jgi:CRP-like cAMP-binding protein
MTSHLQKINQLMQSFDKDTKDCFDKISSVKTLKKGELLLQAGEICRKSFYITNGIARKFYWNESKEITTEFYFANDLAVSFSSYVFQKPSREHIECLTDITVLITDYQTFQEAKQRFPQLVELDLLMTEFYTAWLEERMFEFHTLNATQRYEKILQQSPYLIQQVQLTHIASYLGISLETLSRSRAKI